jgi:hypothetical protein
VWGLLLVYAMLGEQGGVPSVWAGPILLGVMAPVVSIGFLLFCRHGAKMERGYYPNGPRDKGFWKRFMDGEPLSKKAFQREFDRPTAIGTFRVLASFSESDAVQDQSQRETDL